MKLGTEPTMLYELKVKALGADAFADVTRWLAATGTIICYIAGIMVPYLPLLFMIPSFLVNLNSFRAHRIYTREKARQNPSTAKPIKRQQKWKLVHALLLAAAITINTLVFAGIIASPILPIILAGVISYEFLHFVRRQKDSIDKKRESSHTDAEQAASLQKNINFTQSKIIAGMILAISSFLLIFNPATAFITAPLALAATAIPLLGRVHAGEDFLHGSTKPMVWLHRITALVALTGFVLLLAVPGLNIAPAIVGAAVALSYGGAMLQYFAKINPISGNSMFSSKNLEDSPPDRDSAEVDPNIQLGEEFKPRIHQADNNPQKPQPKYNSDVKQINLYLRDLHKKLPQKKPPTEIKMASGNVEKLNQFKR
jgi:hypothetical protein